MDEKTIDDEEEKVEDITPEPQDMEPDASQRDDPMVAIVGGLAKGVASLILDGVRIRRVRRVTVSKDTGPAVMLVEIEPDIIQYDLVTEGVIQERIKQRQRTLGGPENKPNTFMDEG